MYNFKEIEEKWQKYWEDNKTFKTDAWDFSICSLTQVV